MRTDLEMVGNEMLMVSLRYSLIDVRVQKIGPEANLILMSWIFFSDRRWCWSKPLSKIENLCILFP
jgi:hypothetical protein